MAIFQDFYLLSALSWFYDSCALIHVLRLIYKYTHSMRAVVCNICVIQVPFSREANLHEVMLC